MAVFRKLLNNAKGKSKSGNINIDSNGPRVLGKMEEDAEEFARRKQEWQEELDSMSDFLELKSTEEQKEEGAENLVDTAFIGDREGLPVLKAVFDVHYFTPDEVFLSIEDDQLVLEAYNLDDRKDRAFKKTMNRRIDIPKHVYTKKMYCQISEKGILTIEMPFHLPPQRKPQGPNVFPIIEDKDGRRKIRLGFMLGTEFTNDDIIVEKNGAHGLTIIASYDAAVGKYGIMRNKRDLKMDYMLPKTLEVDTVKHSLSPDGKLYIEIMLIQDTPYKCQVTTEDVS